MQGICAANIEYFPKYFFSALSWEKRGAFGKRAAGSKEDSAFLCGGLPEIVEEDFFCVAAKKACRAERGQKSKTFSARALRGCGVSHNTPRKNKLSTTCEMYNAKGKGTGKVALQGRFALRFDAVLFWGG